MGNFLTSIAALGAADEISRKNAAASHDVDVSIARKNADIEDMNLRNNMLQGDQQFNQSYIEELKDEIEDLQREVEQYKQLLSKPMLEIANKNGSFKKEYHTQQKLLSNWIVSQKAFKEVAIKYGIQAGKSRDEIVNEGMGEKENILKDKSKFGNNIESGTLVEDYKDELLNDLHAKQNKNTA